MAWSPATTTAVAEAETYFAPLYLLSYPSGAAGFCYKFLRVVLYSSYSVAWQEERHHHPRFSIIPGAPKQQQQQQQQRVFVYVPMSKR